MLLLKRDFGADLGAEKFLDVKCRRMGIHPDAVVIVATVRALKLHGGADKANLNEEDLDALNKGLHNLKKHIENMTNVYKLNTVVAINKFTTDTDKEINTVVDFVNKLNVKAIPINVWAHGGAGAIDLAKEVLELTKEKNSTFEYCYDENDSIKEKIEKISKKIYGAKNVIFSEKANKNIALISNGEIDKFPVVIAKTQYSLSDNPKLLAIEGDFDITIRDVEVRTGAKMIVALAGDMLLMPGLGKEPAATKMHIDSNEIIDGLF